MSGWQECGKFKTTLTEVKNEWCSYPLSVNSPIFLVTNLQNNWGDKT